MKTISNLFLILAVLLSDVMCAVVAYNYCDMMWGIKYAVIVLQSRLHFW